MPFPELKENFFIIPNQLLDEKILEDLNENRLKVFLVYLRYMWGREMHENFRTGKFKGISHDVLVEQTCLSIDEVELAESQLISMGYLLTYDSPTGIIIGLNQGGEEE
ncbi:hypothetical protein EHQ53_14205 [Leptospira langatensis]|uniref:Phage replisome organiser N-terminal domain-containing protein n=1 Tax=Leptospira langatensis TaxID=2484983 RepID=A0ABY2MCI6_9LEPT|nr:hypothetical protein [Leptospira langatensis]TGL39671.1 hypothetical protein EHQ53_14205 [Leptospira langatensis]